MSHTRDKKVSKVTKITSNKKVVTTKTKSPKSLTKSSKPRYSHDDRVQIKTQIENLQSEEEYSAIFEILNDDPNNSYSCNKNGLFLNMATLADDTLDHIIKYLKTLKKKSKEPVNEEVDIIPGLFSESNTRTYKLSNYEKNIIKQRNLKKILNQDTDYQELKVNS